MEHAQAKGAERRRRALVVAGAAITMVGLLRAQPSSRTARLGYLGPPASDADGRELFSQLRSALERLGWVEGSRIEFVLRLPPIGDVASRDAMAARIASMAQELAAAKVDVIVAMSTRCAQAAKAATTTIPIVFLAEKPVENGLVASLPRPGANVTGVTYHIDALVAKRVQLLKQAVPGIRRIAFVAPKTASDDLYPHAREAGRLVDVEVSFVGVERAADLEVAFDAGSPVDAWIVEDYSMFGAHMERIIALVASSRKAAMYGDGEWVKEGGLMAYSDDRADWPRKVAGLADRVLRGAKPAELPVEEPTRFMLSINRKTARALGVTIAPSILLQADAVVE